MKKLQYVLIALIAVCFIIPASDSYGMGKKPELEIKDESMEGRISSMFNEEKPIVTNLVEAGLNEEEIIRILIIHQSSEIPIIQITNFYKDEGMKWADITAKYELDTDAFNKETMNMLVYLGMESTIEQKEK